MGRPGDLNDDADRDDADVELGLWRGRYRPDLATPRREIALHVIWRYRV